MKAILLIALVLSAATAFDYQSWSQPIIEEINSLNTSWTAGHNPYFDGKTYEEIRKLMGSLPEPSWLQLPETDIEPLSAIPDSWDPRQVYPNC
jgi:hypothetical protein